MEYIAPVIHTSVQQMKLRRDFNDSEYVKKESPLNRVKRLYNICLDGTLGPYTIPFISLNQLQLYTRVNADDWNHSSAVFSSSSSIVSHSVPPWVSGRHAAKNQQIPTTASVTPYERSIVVTIKRSSVRPLKVTLMYRLKEMP
ncbi:hypothetical protein CRG98_016775, partial [Punica granatum]